MAEDRSIQESACRLERFDSEVLTVQSVGTLACSTTRIEIDTLLDAWSDQFVAEEEETAVDEVYTDADFDRLTGASGADWFIVGEEDKITDLKKQNRDGDQVSYL